MKRLLFISLFLALALSACVPRFEWVKPGNSESQRDYDLIVCQMQADQAIPKVQIPNITFGDGNMSLEERRFVNGFVQIFENDLKDIEKQVFEETSVLIRIRYSSWELAADIQRILQSKSVAEIDSAYHFDVRAILRAYLGTFATVRVSGDSDISKYYPPKGLIDRVERHMRSYSRYLNDYIERMEDTRNDLVADHIRHCMLIQGYQNIEVVENE